MCTAAAAVMLSQIGGGILQGNAAKAEGESKQSYYNYLAGQNEIQATRVGRSAEEQVGAVNTTMMKEKEELQRSTRKVVGLQKATMSASGVWGNSRTAEDIARDTSTQEGRDLAALRYNADITAAETRRQAEETARALKEQGSGYRRAGEMARSAGRIGQLSSIIGTASNVASTWALWQSVKTPKDGWLLEGKV